MKTSSTVLFEINGKKLYREKNLIDVYVPIFFVCMDSNLQRYLTICLDDETDEYLITKISNEKLIKMLNGSMPMRDAYTLSQEIFYIKAGKSYKEDVIEKKMPFELQDDDLPDQNALFEIKSKDIDEYIAKLSDKVTVFNTKSDYESIGVKIADYNLFYQQVVQQKDYKNYSYKLKTNTYDKQSETTEMELFNDQLLAAA